MTKFKINEGFIITSKKIIKYFVRRHNNVKDNNTMISQNKRCFVGRARGTSMEPIINSHDKLFIQDISINDLRIGDIITYYVNSKLVSHRIIKFSNQMIITKGDNCFFRDKDVHRNSILGKLVRIEGKYGMINLNSSIYFFCRFYFFLRSLFILYCPFYLKKLTLMLKIDREILIKFVAFFNNFENDKTSLLRRTHVSRNIQHINRKISLNNA